MLLNSVVEIALNFFWVIIVLIAIGGVIVIILHSLDLRHATKREQIRLEREKLRAGQGEKLPEMEEEKKLGGEKEEKNA